MTEKRTIELSLQTLQALHVMALDHPIPRHMAIAAIQEFERALAPSPVEKEPAE